jgi:glycosyltransferase involved in cell wall biosynthesis
MNGFRKKEKINILYLIDHLYGFGGSERHLFQLAMHLNKSRFSYVICPFMWKEDTVQKFIDNKIAIKRVPLERIYGVKALLQSLKLIGLIKKNKIDIVQTFHFSSDALGSLLARIAGVSYIVSSRRDMGDLKKKSHVLISRLMNKLVDRFIVVSNAVSRNFALNEGIPVSKTVTIYNGVDLCNWLTPSISEINKVKSEHGINRDSFVIGYVAHFRPGKGYDVFFEAIKRLKPLIGNMKVLIVGGRGSGLEMMNHYKRFCRDHHLEDIVIFAGYAEKVSSYYAVMDVYCLVSDNEGCSNSLMEAMASARPVIATAVGGNREVVIDGVSGILIPPQNPEALVQAILRLYEKPELRQKMAANSRKLIEQQFSLQKMVERTEQFYLQLFNREKAKLEP